MPASKTGAKKRGPSQEQCTHRQFASDNYAGICPEAWAALEEANSGHCPAYGEDRWTREVSDQVRELFEIDCEVFFTFNGTAANSLVLSTLCRPYHAVVCHEIAHVETDECGGPEFFSGGTKILTCAGAQGKIGPEAVEHAVTRRTDIHYPKPKALSLTQATEVGTVYAPAELDQLSETVRRLNLKVHMDGARFANAVAELNVSPKELTWKVGVDVLCFGGTKNGLPVGEAVIFFDKVLAEEFDYRCKQAGQLASKMRFLSAPWLGMLKDGAWLRHARQANRMAALLEQKLSNLPGIEIMFPRQANSVFARMPEWLCEGLWARGWMFYNFIGKGGCRLMCAWDTTEADVESLARDAKEVIEKHTTTADSGQLVGS